MALRMRTHTEYDFRHVEELQRVVSKSITTSVTRRSRISSIAWGVCALMFMVFLIARDFNLVIAVLAGLMGLFMLARGVFYYKFVTLGIRQTMDKEVTGSDYILEKSYMLVTNPKGSTQYAYSDCYRLLETEGNFYYIMKNGQGLILDKTELKGGSVDELRAWMEEKCGKKAEWMGKKKQ